ncbi:MAG TPA: response regulator [Candidatus Limnocylindria bacterium]|nr:response regulator [Candidatus Limnocylindria bacterium]
MSDLKRVTVINDSPEFLELMADLLHDANYPATLIDGDRDNATYLIEASQPEILIIDLRLGTEDLKGLDLLRWVRQHAELSNVPTIVCTADKWGIERVEEEVRSMENVKVLLKPFSVAELYSVLRELQPV